MKILEKMTTKKMKPMIASCFSVNREKFIHQETSFILRIRIHDYNNVFEKRSLCYSFNSISVFIRSGKYLRKQGKERDKILNDPRYGWLC